MKDCGPLPTVFLYEGKGLTGRYAPANGSIQSERMGKGESESILSLVTVRIGFELRPISKLDSLGEKPSG